MKISCQKENLLNGVQIVSKAVSARTTMTLTECILVQAQMGEIKLTANDLELGIETKIEGEISERGMVALDARIFSEIVRKLPDSEITIETDANLKTTITCEKSKFNIMGKDGAEFSTLPSVERRDSITISQFMLKDIIRQTIFSISDNTSNPTMTGELFDINGDILQVVSLDGHRVSIRKIELGGTYDAKKVIVPGKTLNEVSKILSGDMDKQVEIYFTENHVLFAFEDTVVVSRLIEGNFLKIDQMLSGDYETKITVNKKDLLDCIDRATLLVKEGDKKPVIINITDECMEMKMNSLMGSMDEEVDITKSGKDLMIGFNPKFMMDALRVIDDEEVDLYMVNPKAPCFIKNQEESYIYIILPVNFTTVG